jgi:hypothetical protein
VIAAGVATLASAATNGSTGEHHRTQVFRVFEQTVKSEFVNVGAPAFSLGDQQVFSSDLLRHRGGSKLGTDGGACTAVRILGPDSGVFQCVVTAAFSRGQITTQALVEFADGQTPPPLDIATTGGTGKFEGASGHVNVKELSETESILTFYVRHEN